MQPEFPEFSGLFFRVTQKFGSFKTWTEKKHCPESWGKMALLGT